MTPQKQKYRHDPDNGVFGDCYRTCLAMLLGLPRDDVPHYVTTMDPDAWKETVQPKYDSWLSDRGLIEVAIAYACDLDTLLSLYELMNPKAHYMLTGKSGTGCNHVVVCRGGEIVCDPAQNDSGIVDKTDDGFLWVSFLAVQA
jgi:hypothetical protein